MNEATIASLVRSLAPVFSEYVSQATTPLLKRIEELEAREPEKGETGTKGERGDMGERGEQGLQGLKGETGEPGARGERGEPGPKGKTGEPGKDGVGVVDGLIDSKGELVLTFSNGVTKSVGRVVGRDGINGKDAGADTIRAIVSEIAGEKSFDPETIKALLPQPIKGADGAPGERGESAYQVAVRNGFNGSEKEWLESLNGRDGVDGEDGAPGCNGEKGADGIDGSSVTLEDVRPLIEAEVKKIPTPKDGKDGAPGPKGDKGETGPIGEKGSPGVGVSDIHIDQEGTLKVKTSDGKVHDCGVVVGPEGPAGRDGFGFDDFRLEHDGERTVKFIWEKDEARRESPVKFPIPIHRDVYQPEKQYERGDVVTYGGSQWTAQRDTSERPGSENSGWMLSVKRGRDGKNGDKGDKGDEGKAGRPGRDLTQMGPDGSKW